MKQFILNEPPDADGIVRISGEDFHYLVRVRRLKPGSILSVIFPGGERAELNVLTIADGILTGKCKKETDFSTDSSPDKKMYQPIILFQGLPRGSKMDLIVRQAAESGIKTIAPFISENSTAKSGSKEKTERWNKIVKEARQQSDSQISTEVKPVNSIDGIIDYWKQLRRDEPRTTGIFFHEKTLAEGSFHEYLYSNPPQVVLVVGPEGGFSPEEAKRFMKEGFSPLVIGKTILRSETAALYGAAAIRIILLENTSWILKKI